MESGRAESVASSPLLAAGESCIQAHSIYPKGLTIPARHSATLSQGEDTLTSHRLEGYNFLGRQKVLRYLLVYRNYLPSPSSSHIFQLRDCYCVWNHHFAHTDRMFSQGDQHKSITSYFFLSFLQKIALSQPRRRAAISVSPPDHLVPAAPGSQCSGEQWPQRMLCLCALAARLLPEP